MLSKYSTTELHPRPHSIFEARGQYERNLSTEPWGVQCPEAREMRGHEKQVKMAFEGGASYPETQAADRASEMKTENQPLHLAVWKWPGQEQFQVACWE
jgi:hypothetical protein